MKHCWFVFVSLCEAELQLKEVGTMVNKWSVTVFSNESVFLTFTYVTAGTGLHQSL